MYDDQVNTTVSQPWCVARPTRAVVLDRVNCWRSPPIRGTADALALSTGYETYSFMVGSHAARYTVLGSADTASGVKTVLRGQA